MTGQAAVAVFTLGVLVAPMAAQAAEAVAMLNVHNARCELCPLIVRAALNRVRGVEAVDIGQPNSKGDMMATVVFDDTVTKPADLIKATADHGYPAQVAKQMPAVAIENMKPMR